MFTCPLCGRKMYHDFCTVCKLKIDVQNRTVYIDSNAPNHTVDVYNFLKAFLHAKPLFVMSRFPITDSNFRLKDCYFSGSNHPAGTRQDIGESMTHLIAGSGFITNNIRKYLYFCINQKDANNPLCESRYASPEEILFEQALLESIEMRDSDVCRVVDIYLSPMLESIAAYFLPGEFGDVLQLSDEQAVFSLMCNSPSKNITWATKVSDLTCNIKNYLKTCLQDLDDYKSESEKVPDRLYPVLHDMLESHPSLLVNQTKKQDCYFDVMDYKDARSIVLELDVQCRDNDMYIKQLHIIRDICVNLFSNVIGLYDISVKKEFLAGEGIRPGTTPDETVLRFWKTVYNKIFVE